MADLSGRTLGEFILREQIGEGYGAVYRGEQPPLERNVVVKASTLVRIDPGLLVKNTGLLGMFGTPDEDPTS